MLDWLIIGAGIHGFHLAASLRRQGCSLRMIDPHPQPLAEWDRRAEALAMTHLRSPIEQDLDVDPLGLHHFAEAHHSVPPGWFAGPCRAPALDLFRRHVSWIRARLGLDATLAQATAQAIDPRAGEVVVETDRGSLRARRVVLAIGRPRPCVPVWADAIGGAALHVFDPRFAADPGEGPAIVVGGGLSAIQLALHWARRRPGQVTLVCRRPPVVAELDASPRWAQPGWVGRFASLPLGGRAAVLERETRRGSVPRNVAQRLARAQRRGQLCVVRGEVVRADPRELGCALELADGRTLAARRVGLATGFASEFAGVAILDQLRTRAGLPVAADATPILDEALRWHSRVHVIGAAARLSLGPLAGNIAGARLAARRLTAFAAG